MLIYHPAYDAFHCMFRLLVITERSQLLDVAKARLADYYFVFPAEIGKARLPKGTTAIKKYAQNSANAYRGPVNGLQVFREMKEIQLTALGALAGAGIIDQHSLAQGKVLRAEYELHPDVLRRLNETIKNADPVLSYIIGEMLNIPLEGENGLKARTGLMEYRYDNA